MSDLVITPKENDVESEHTVDGWSDDIELILNNILDNCNKLQREHKHQFIKLESSLKYFRIPLIILSSINSVFSVGLTTYLEQSLVSTLNCLISLMCACISSVELFLNIHTAMENSLSSYQAYKLLGIKVSSCLKLEREHRDKNSMGFLNEIISEYRNLFEQSLVLIVDLDDKLLNIVVPTKSLLYSSKSNEQTI
jgi:hypothetical protein